MHIIGLNFKGQHILTSLFWTKLAVGITTEYIITYILSLFDIFVWVGNMNVVAGKECM